MTLLNVFPPSTLKQPETKQTIYIRRSFLPIRRDCFWQIQSGVVRTYSWLDDGALVVFGIWSKGDIISPLLSKCDPFKMECLTDVQITSLSLHQQTEINQGLISQAIELQELITIKHHRPYEALMQFLKWLGNKFGEERKNGILINLRLTHQEIAETIGTTRVTVTRLLTLFEQKGMIDRPTKYTIILKDN